MNSNEGLIKTYEAGGTINEYRIVKFGTADRAALQASASTDKFIGVAGLPKGATASSGDSIDVIKSGIADVIYGDTVAVGDYLTSDAQGRAVVATVGDNVIGTAELSGVSGDLGAVHIQKSSIPSIQGS